MPQENAVTNEVFVSRKDSSNSSVAVWFRMLVAHSSPQALKVLPTKQSAMQFSLSLESERLAPQHQRYWVKIAALGHQMKGRCAAGDGARHRPTTMIGPGAPAECSKWQRHSAIGIWIVAATSAT